jgi:hypothetical protein
MGDPDLINDAKTLDLEVQATEGASLQEKLNTLYAAPEDETEAIRRILSK